MLDAVVGATAGAPGGIEPLVIALFVVAAVLLWNAGPGAVGDYLRSHVREEMASQAPWTTTHEHSGRPRRGGGDRPRGASALVPARRTAG